MNSSKTALYLNEIYDNYILCSTNEKFPYFSSIRSKFEGNLGIMQNILGSLKAYGQRISFASSRVEVLQGIPNIDICVCHRFVCRIWYNNVIR
jgi:hypothetical protein